MGGCRLASVVNREEKQSFTVFSDLEVAFFKAKIQTSMMYFRYGGIKKVGSL